MAESICERVDFAIVIASIDIELALQGDLF